jgi:hypothetical protein
MMPLAASASSRPGGLAEPIFAIRLINSCPKEALQKANRVMASLEDVHPESIKGVFEEIA